MHVLRVIELRIEARELREIFHRRARFAQIRVADGTHLVACGIRRNKLREVATRAGFVTGKIRFRRIVCAAPMTRRALKRRVTFARVREFREIHIGRLRGRKRHGSGSDGAHAMIEGKDDEQTDTNGGQNSKRKMSA